MFLYHELAFENTQALITELQAKWGNDELYLIEAKAEDLSLDSAVSSYLYNSQIVGDTDMLLLAPLEARENLQAYQHIQTIINGDNPIKRVEFLDLRESMRNGGGPACLRLRVAASDAELAAIKTSVMFSEELYQELKTCIQHNYREELSPSDLANPNFAIEAQAVTQEIYSILALKLS